MNSRQMTYVLTVLQEGNFTAAAKKLYISQPSLSQSIKQIESNLGALIFDRNADSIRLTPVGEKYVQTAKKMLDLMRNLEKEVAKMRDVEYGCLMVGIPIQRGLQILPYVLPRFHAKNPHIELKVEEYGSGTVETMLRDGIIDMACLSTYPRFSDLEYIPIEEEQLVLLTSSDSGFGKRFPSGTPVKVVDFAEEKMICLKPGHSVRGIMDSLMLEHGLRPNIILETSSIEVGKLTTMELDAVMLLPECYVHTDHDFAERCSIYPLDEVYSKRSLCVCYKKDLHITKYMQDFIDIVTSM